MLTRPSFYLVWIKVGICTADSIINIALCCLGYIPGLLHAWYIIFKYPEPDFIDEPTSGGDVEGNQRVTYYVFHPPPQPRNYGTVGSSAPSQQAQPHPAPRHEDAAGSRHSPPTYAEAVRGDHKVQSHD